ncbi:Protein-tyrosine phosphatase, low molecular weight [Corchorus capsularis]|uniref:Protein-tyrosine phosphatase, low molecular weight n=1 Tax=Corchorus capsularis TaxID=210143 RepID=A0A1R3HG51_COCAP|nr:Protein-tyrosine phosphatase, low molecular weight [Corchorus capsularis]
MSFFSTPISSKPLFYSPLLLTMLLYFFQAIKQIVLLGRTYKFGICKATWNLCIHNAIRIAWHINAFISRAAEGVFRDIVKKKGLDSKFDIESVGTIDYHEGNMAEPRMRATSKRRVIEITSISRPIQPSDFRD